MVGGLPNHFVLRPKTPLTVRQGQQITITCESEGISETKLHWTKQTKKGDVSVPSNLFTVDKDRSTNKVRAFLKISNVQAEDAGVYKCVLRVFDKTDHKMISLYVRGNSSKTYAVIMENVNVEISSTIDEGKHFVVESQTTIEILNRCLSQSLLLYRFQIFR